MAQAGGREAHVRSPHRPATAASVRERLVDAAWGIFARHGFRTITIRDIAAVAGLDVAVVRNCFATTSDAMMGVSDAVTATAEPIYTELGAILPDPRETRIAAWLTSFMAWWEDNEGVLRAIREAAVTDPTITRHIAADFAAVVRRVLEPLSDLSPQQRSEMCDVVLILMAQLDQICLQWHLGALGSMSRDQVIRCQTEIWESTLRSLVRPA